MGSVGPRLGYFSMWRSIRPDDGPDGGDIGEFKSMAMATGRPYAFGEPPLRREGGGPSLPNPTYVVRHYVYLMEQPGNPGSPNVLEVGPGLGRNVFSLLDRGMSVAAAEPDIKMRKILRHFAQKWGVSGRLSVQDSTYQSVRLADGAYHGLVSTGSAQFLGNREAAGTFFRRARRAMRPGGVLLLETNNGNDEYFMRAAKSSVSGLYIPAGDDVRDMLAGCGWEVLHFEADRRIPWLGPFAEEYNTAYMAVNPGAKRIEYRNKTSAVARNPP